MGTKLSDINKDWVCKDEDKHGLDPQGQGQWQELTSLTKLPPHTLVCQLHLTLSLG